MHSSRSAQNLTYAGNLRSHLFLVNYSWQWLIWCWATVRYCSFLRAMSSCRRTMKNVNDKINRIYTIIKHYLNVAYLLWAFLSYFLSSYFYSLSLYFILASSFSSSLLSCCSGVSSLFSSALSYSTTKSSFASSIECFFLYI